VAGALLGGYVSQGKKIGFLASEKGRDLQRNGSQESRSRKEGNMT
jgi:hypothetical protein